MSYPWISSSVLDVDDSTSELTDLTVSDGSLWMSFTALLNCVGNSTSELTVSSSFLLLRVLSKWFFTISRRVLLGSVLGKIEGNWVPNILSLPGKCNKHFRVFGENSLIVSFRISLLYSFRIVLFFGRKCHLILGEFRQEFTQFGTQQFSFPMTFPLCAS